MPRAKFSIPVFSHRHVETPFDKKPGFKNYLAIVEVSDLPDFRDWRRINVRDPKLSALTREMRESFFANKEAFLFLNRGMVLSVAQASFDNKKGILHLTMTDPDVHGLLDGGHTYQIIMQGLSKLKEEGTKQYVKIEVVEGFDPEELVKLVDARNSSNQVRDESLMNLAKDFQQIQDALRGEPYADKIAYKEYQTFENGEPKPISIREVISYLITMDRKNFTRTVHPINAYRSKAACLKHFAQHKDDFKPIYPIAKEVLRLWDTIHLELPELYNKMRGERGGVSGGKFGKLTGVAYLDDSNRQSLDFLDVPSRYVIPAGLKYPILGAFRALLVERRGKYAWADGIEPSALLRSELGKDLVQTIGEFAARRPKSVKNGQIDTRVAKLLPVR